MPVALPPQLPLGPQVHIPSRADTPEPGPPEPSGHEVGPPTPPCCNAALGRASQLPCWGPGAGHSTDKAHDPVRGGVALPTPGRRARGDLWVGMQPENPSEGGAGRLVLWGSSLSLSLAPHPSQTLLPAPVVLPSVHELDLFR